MLKEFPLYLNIKDKAIDENYFKNINKIRLLSLIRNEIHNLIVGRKDENDCFDLDFFNKKYDCRDLYYEIVDIIIKELNELGWKTQLSFGDTCLFIYSTEETPKSCW
jgi:hypothetical protein